MGFVAKLFGVFVPIVLAMIFYQQRDHILGEERNAIFEQQLTRFGEQLNHHLDSIVDQLNAFVGETKAIVETEEESIKNEIPNDEIDLKEKIRKETAKSKESSEAAEKSADQKPTEQQSTEQPSKPSSEQSTKICDLGKDRLITKQQLTGYNGEDPKKKIYLAFLGIVYDVSYNNSVVALNFCLLTSFKLMLRFLIWIWIITQILSRTNRSAKANSTTLRAAHTPCSPAKTRPERSSRAISASPV